MTINYIIRMYKDFCLRFDLLKFKSNIFIMNIPDETLQSGV
jgi:hypothetical protein